RAGLRDAREIERKDQPLFGRDLVARMAQQGFRRDRIIWHSCHGSFLLCSDTAIGLIFREFLPYRMGIFFNWSMLIKLFNIY
ncbi:MAG TPA: hypothetical protein DCF61_11530, partial [Alphaproteobacteria bacterium]|nr:hypothetical protein [Alphaproteobacteria bacterium]